MDWNLNPSRQQKLSDQVLDNLENQLYKRPMSRFKAQAQAINLQDGLQRRNCVNQQPAQNGSGSAFKRANAGRDKWFDAK